MARSVPLVTCRGIAMSGSIANAAEHYSAWSRCAFDVCHAIARYRFLHFTFSHSHFASTHANAPTRGFCNMGTSCAMNSRPRGSIQRPKTGRKLKKPPRMSSNATTRRTANEDGLRNHRMD
jgi:hypothetical protein